MNSSPVRKQWPRLVLRAVLGFLALAMCAAILVYVFREPEPEPAPPIQARLELAAGQVTVAGRARATTYSVSDQEG